MTKTGSDGRRAPDTRRLVRAGALLAAAGVVVAAGWASVIQLQHFRYGERGARARVALVDLMRAEWALRDRTGAFAPVEVTAGSAFGRVTAPEGSRRDEGLEWVAPAGTGFSYRLTTLTTSAGQPAFAACAEADLDGDGVAQAVVAFEPAADAQGALVAPPAPCRHARRLDRPLTYAGEAGPFRASPPDVF